MKRVEFYTLAIGDVYYDPEYDEWLEEDWDDEKDGVVNCRCINPPEKERLQLGGDLVVV